mmetsp:Transcript_41300/g.88714  ORF Transcript_41300/g.88714 Transcript_41300/m.88714 type:complete len:223 (+) Transcript_41300:790-1458(+)
MVADDEEPIIFRNSLQGLLEPGKLGRAVLSHDVIVEVALLLWALLAFTELSRARIPTRGAVVPVGLDAGVRVDENDSKVLVSTQQHPLAPIVVLQLPTIVVGRLVLHLRLRVVRIIMISQDSVPGYHQGLVGVDVLESLLELCVCDVVNPAIVEVVPSVQDKLKTHLLAPRTHLLRNCDLRRLVVVVSILDSSTAPVTDRREGEGSGGCWQCRGCCEATSQC